MSGLDKVKEELMKVIEKEVQDYTDEIYRSGYADGYAKARKDYEEENVKKCGKCLISYNGASCSSCEEVRQNDEIKVGDEVKVYDDCIGIVTRHAPQARTCYVMYRDGSCGEEELTDCKKTGNHSMSLDKWLEQMRKESE